jgi:hypothetical protein
MLLLFGLLVHLYFTSSYSIFSDRNPAGNIQDIQPKIERMEQKIDRYNQVLDDAVRKSETTEP